MYIFLISYFVICGIKSYVASKIVHLKWKAEKAGN